MSFPTASAVSDGLRIRTLIEFSNEVVRGQRGVLIVGAYVQTVRGDGPGSVYSFYQVVTGDDGYYNEPDARTNADWNVEVNFSTAVPPCFTPIVSGTQFIPSGGGEVDFICLL